MSSWDAVVNTCVLFILWCPCFIHFTSVHGSVSVASVLAGMHCKGPVWDVIVLSVCVVLLYCGGLEGIEGGHEVPQLILHQLGCLMLGGLELHIHHIRGLLDSIYWCWGSSMVSFSLFSSIRKRHESSQCGLFPWYLLRCWSFLTAVRMWAVILIACTMMGAGCGVLCLR